MEQLMKAINETIKREGIDLIGYAPKSRFDALPPQTNPFSIFPEGKTVIMVGRRICRGALRGVEEGTNFGDYNLFGRNWLEDEFLSIASYALTNTLEDFGWEAVPLFPNPSEIAPTGISVGEGRPAPNVFPDFDYAAVACGVCEIGMNGTLLSEKYGTRQRFHMIITDAELEPTPILEKSICNGCMECANACPLGAVSKTEFEEINICGKVMKVAKIDYNKCKACKNGAIVNRFSVDAKPDRIAALCNRTCMTCLEENKCISNLFENSFRNEPAWSIGGNCTYSPDPTEQANVVGGAYSTTVDRGNRR